MKGTSFIALLFCLGTAHAQDRIELNPGGAASGDLMGLKATETGNNTTLFHIFKNFTNQTSDEDLLTIDRFGNTELYGTSKLHWNPQGGAPGDRFGIKVTESGNNTTKLHFFRNFTGDSQDLDALVIDANRKVGIGTASPTSELEIKSPLNNHAELHINSSSDDGVSIIRFQDAGTSTWGFLANYPGSGKFSLYNYQLTSNAFVFDSNGNMGIGTANPGAYRLAVNGSIRAKEIKVETGWADYVFKEGYDLPTLEEVEKHIKEKGHLMNIPSAKEVEENGIQLGEMNRLLLEKIEELTLYLITQDKAIKTLQEENQVLKDLVKEIKLIKPQFINYDTN
ncbi:hypothetical protein GTQ34_16030 [Muricauda sp. JGD-17]|uniref:Endosialidase-like protein n=1 Tax=Flagellimonas ochracea TaxID=2696472 RepID=A0A964TEE2_9FLAO|nr:hypothetical protein [Allomuricauda ochracea]NAY93420.1 hypothetical protein [Allomuricauda ochracea]